MSAPTLTLVLVTEGPARLAGAALAERFPHVRVETGSVLVKVSRRESPETILDYCKTHGLGVVASCVVSRSVVHPATLRAEPIQ